ncbi:MAG: CinA family protein [Candidatus Omnitrophica bacterium]|nr:CinA family protein [Candidatus Omnitrophota bacterium]
MRIEEKIAKLLINTKKTVAIAESCTGGLLSNRLTNIPGSSKFLKFALVAYSNESKIKLLKVPRTAIRKYGSVSRQVAVFMAQGARQILNTDFGIGITGIAGPTGATKTKPTGLTFIAICTDTENICLECQFKGARKSIKTQAATQALRLLNEFLT